MFYVDGLRPITELHIAFILASSPYDDEEVHAQQRSPEQNRETLHETLEEVIRRLSEVVVLLPTGFLAKGPRSLIADLSGWQSEHVDLLVGTVGSGWVRDDLSSEDPHVQRLELERRYGILLGCPVMFNQSELDNALRTKFPWHTPELIVDPGKAAAVAKAVAELNKPRRGPPGWYRGLFKHMVRKHFAPLIARGEYAGKQKKDAYIDAVEWLRDLTDEEVPLDTVEGWVRPLWSKDVGK